MESTANNKLDGSWFPFERRREHRFEDETVVSCFLGKMFQFYEGRNVWGPQSDLFGGGRVPNLRNTYPGFGSFCFGLTTAKERVESLRKKGSRWTIRELPSLVLSGEKSSLIIGEMNSDKPLSRFGRLGKGRPSLEEYGLCFDSYSEDSVFRIVCNRCLVLPAELPFCRHESKTFGGSYGLAWEMSVLNQDLRTVLRVICRVNELAQRKAHLAERPRAV
jgi:hypothetical protein